MITRVLVCLAAVCVLAGCSSEEPGAEANAPPPFENASAGSAVPSAGETPYETASAEAADEAGMIGEPAAGSGEEITSVGQEEPEDEEDRAGQDSVERDPAEEDPIEEDPAAEVAGSEGDGWSDPSGEESERAVSPSGLHVVRAYVCKGIEQSEPTEAGKSFVPEADGYLRLCCFSEVGGADATDQIFHVWYWGDREMARVSLAVKGSRWRTWSTKKIVDEWRGEWRVDVTDADGFVLSSLEFSVE
jgi:hypothetical protein